jgi:hypothetical protein
MPTETSSTDLPDSAKWSWLQGTYWYVPEAYLLAMNLSTTSTGEQQITAVKDQTLWQIVRFENGYIIGRAALSFGGESFMYQTIIGSVTPEGDVLLSFRPEENKESQPTSDGSATVSTGPGRMALIQGKWAIVMQMTNGTATSNLTHWAYMLQSTPSDPSWTDIPGIPGISIGEVFAPSGQ